MSQSPRPRVAVVLVLLFGGCSDSGSSAADAPFAFDSPPPMPPDARAPIGSCDKTSCDVTTPGFEYAFDGVRGNPAVIVCAGHTYTFHLRNTSPEHPFCIWNGNNQNDAPGVTGNCVTGTADVVWIVPASLPNGGQYRCDVHFFGNSFVVQ